MSLPRFGIAWMFWALASTLAWASDFLPTSGEWTNPTNWNPPLVPTRSDDVTIGVGKTARLSDPGLLTNARNLTVDGTLDLSLGSGTASLTCTGNLTVNGSLLIGGSTGGVDGRLILTNSTPTISGNGTITFGSGSGDTTLEVLSGASVAVTGPITLIGSGWRLIQTETSDGGISCDSAVVTFGSTTKLTVPAQALEVLNGVALSLGGTTTLGQRAQIRYDGNPFSRFTTTSTSQLTWTVNGNGLAGIQFPGAVSLAGTLTIDRPLSLTMTFDDTITLIGTAFSVIQGDFSTVVGSSDWAVTSLGTSYQLSFILELQTMSWTSVPTAVAPGSADITLPSTTREGRPITYAVTRVDGTAASSTLIGSRTLRPALSDENIRIVATSPRFTNGASHYDALYSTWDVLVSAATPQTVTIDPLVGPFYYGQTLTLTGSCTSGATLAWSTTDSARLAITGSQVRVIGTGASAPVTATAPATGVYTTATTTTAIGALLPRPVTVTVDGGTRTFGATNPSPSVTYENLAPGDAPEVLGSPVYSGIGTTANAGTAVGSYAVNAAFPANTNYTITVVPGSLVITQRPQIITFPSIPPLTSGQSATLAATSDLGLAVVYSSSNTAVATVSGTTIRAVGPGSATITATQAGNSTTEAASATQSVSVIMATTITIGSLSGTASYGDVVPLVGTASSGAPLTWTSSSSLITIDGTTAIVRGTGSGATVTASCPATGNFAAASATGTFGTFQGKAATVTVSSATRVFGETNPLPAFTVTGLLDTDTVSSLGTPIFSGTGITAGPTTVGGSYPITVTFSPTNPNYRLTTVAGSLTITKLPQTLTFPTISRLTVGQTATLAATSNLGLAVTYTSGTPSMATVAGNVLRAVGPGTATITATQGGTTSVQSATTTQTVTIDQVATITIGSLTGPYTYGDQIPLVGSSSSGAPVSWSSSSPLVSITGSTATVLAAGSGATVAASCPAVGSFAAGSASGAFGTFRTKSVTVTVASASRTYGDPNPTPTLTVNGLISGDTESMLGTPTFSGNGTTAGALTVPGDYPITVSFAPANPNYAITVVPGTLTITKRAQVLTFPPLASLSLDQTSTLGATTDASLPLTYTSSDIHVATVSGSTLTAIAAGTATITASQAGDSIYLPATATQVITITGERRPQTLSIDPLPGPYAYGDVLTLSGSTTSGQALTWSSSSGLLRVTGSTATVIGAGSGATITATTPQTIGYLSATTTLNLPTLLPRPVVVQVSSLQRPIGNDIRPTPSFSVSNLAPGDTPASLGTPTYSGTGTTAGVDAPTGTYPITVTFAPPNPNYAVQIQAGSLRVTGIVDPQGAEVTSSGSRGCGVGGTGLALVGITFFIFTRSRSRLPYTTRHP